MVQKWVRVLAALIAVGALFTGPRVMGAIPGFHLTGLAIHQETGRDIYLGAIYLDQPADPSIDYRALAGRMIMEYRVVARRTSMRSLLGGTLLQSEVATGQAPAPKTVEFANSILSSVQGSLYAGDAFEVRLSAEGETAAYLNGHELASVADSAVANYLIQGWIGERGPSTAFRNAMLAGPIDSGLLARLENTRFSSEREQQVAAWLEPVAPATGAPDPETESLMETEAVAAPVPATVAEASPPLPELADPGNSSVTAEEPVQVASLIPSAAMLPASRLEKIDIQDYSRQVSSFHKQLVKMVYSEIRYPRRAVKRNIQGRLELDITLKDDGELVNVAVVRSSGHELLDRAGVAAAEQAFEDQALEKINAAAITEFGSERDPGQLVVPVPIMFMLTQ